jgi:hypothetical protein
MVKKVRVVFMLDCRKNESRSGGYRADGEPGEEVRNDKRRSWNS